METIVVRNALTHRLMVIRVVRLRRRRGRPSWAALIARLAPPSAPRAWIDPAIPAMLETA